MLIITKTILILSMEEVTIFWFRRDLRLEDNTALNAAIKTGKPILPVFIFDEALLHKLHSKKDLRVQFIHEQVSHLYTRLRSIGSCLQVYHGSVKTVFIKLLQKYRVNAVYFNEDYDPFAIARDAEIRTIAENAGSGVFQFKDHVIYAKDEVTKEDGTPYLVFTPYYHKWLLKFQQNTEIGTYPVSSIASYLYKEKTAIPMPQLEELGFAKLSNIVFPSFDYKSVIKSDYESTRDYPFLENGTSQLGIHLRYGTISIRAVARLANERSTVYLKELAWRDFFQTLLYHFPKVASGSSFKKDYDDFKWDKSAILLEKWKLGQTGFPMVDAAMRQLSKTGYMHNRLRMITACFLSKYLNLDWHLGESWFASLLLDYDLAANNGNWQWASGSGCDAVPYFRFFNPILQQVKYDPNRIYIRKWIPELDSKAYPAPIIDLKTARMHYLSAFQKHKEEQKTRQETRSANK